MIGIYILLGLLALLLIYPFKQKCSCGSENFSYRLPGVEESLYCTKCNKNYYSIED